jgi:transposase
MGARRSLRIGSEIIPTLRLPALLKQLEAAEDLAEATRLVFQQHPQRAIFTSYPGLGELPAARLLAEIGDDATRFADARGLKAYAGAAPVTRASGKKLGVLHRKVKNQRLDALGCTRTRAALTSRRALAV